MLDCCLLSLCIVYRFVFLFLGIQSKLVFPVFALSNCQQTINQYKKYAAVGEFELFGKISKMLSNIICWQQSRLNIESCTQLRICDFRTKLKHLCLKYVVVLLLPINLLFVCTSKFIKIL